MESLEKTDRQTAGSGETSQQQQQHRPQQGAKTSRCWSTVTSVGKCLLLIILIPPFLNYASLQREGQLLLPEGGEIIDIGLGQKMHLMCKGQGQPVVILDAPTGMSSDIWFHVQENIALLTKVCTYDRVGLGFSKRVLQNESTGTEKVWGMSTTGRMVDNLHRLIGLAGLATPLILVGSELGTLNARFYSHIHDAQVSDLVLIDPIPEDIFEEDQWQKYWYSQRVPSLQAMQFSAATGISRILIILGLLKPAIMGDNIAEDLLQRQKYLLSNPAHQSSAVDEHFFLNESASQVREISKFKPLSSRTSVSVIIGDYFDEQIPAALNQVVAQLQKTLLEQTYPSANQIHVKGGDRRMIYKRPSVVSKHLLKLVSQRQSKQQSQ
uniref:AB hydrolase-1 domain-containing protein n=1 Tax=Oncorhynchus tshawytscha TaxID=74940 RepID=A0A8C8JE43_ONCTS